ncbi:MAG: hypothetical protein JSS11_15975 [Verrucomicrobia bacterium]|nr:hypothetical protein [Verrucomicrobiota bacterium]
MLLLQSKKAAKGRKWRRRLLWVILAAMIAGGWLAFEPLRERYHHWKQQRALQQAKAFIEKRDAPNAQLALEVALQAVPGNADTLRVAADMLEQVGAAQAMRLRRAVVQIQPDSADDAAKLVLSCLRFRDFNAAKDALSATSPKVSREVPMLQAALAYALSTDDRPMADILFKELKAKSPNDEKLRHAHALLLLRHPQEAQRKAARADLEALAKSDPKLALEINREFLGFALQQKDYPEARARLKAILADPATTLNDRLQQANLDLLIDKQPFEGVYAQLAPLAGRNAQDAADFVQWLMVQNRFTEAAAWLAGLPETIRATPAVLSVRAEVAAQQKEWDRLQSLLEAGAWGPISKDTLKLAYAAKTVDSPNKPSLRHDTWDMALASAGSSLGSYRVLQRLAAVWQWDDESERTLWTIARAYPDQTWAHQALFNLYRRKKNTAAMREVMETLRQSDGSVLRYQHDWALLTLILDPNSNWNQAKETMKGLYENSPTDATYATGYAFALAQAGRGSDAMAIVDKLTADERNYAPRQPYLAFIYGVAKRSEDLDHTVKAGQGVTYLPEESYLFVRAKEELTRKPAKPKASEAKAKS